MSDLARVAADYNLLGAAFCASLQELGLRGAEEHCTAAVESFPATAAGADSAAGTPQPSPQPPRFLKPCQLASKQMNPFRTHHESIPPA